MKKMTQEEIETAKQIDLLSYMLRYEPEELVRVGPHDYKTKTHGSLCISDNGFWNWTSRGFGGKNALKYLTEVKQMSFPDAVRLLNSDYVVQSSFQQVHSTADKIVREKKALLLPDKDLEPHAVTDYLRKRGISWQVLHYCLSNGLVYQTTNKGHPNCVFVGVDNESQPKAACVRGCQGMFRGEVSGSQKRFSFHLPAETKDCNLLEVYEAPIDAMSGATLRQYSGKNWRSVSYLSLGGLNYIALEHYLSQHPTVRILRFCLDNDEPGREFTKKLKERYQGKGYTVEDRPPRIGKDYNDTLQAYCSRKNVKTQKYEKWR